MSNRFPLVLNNNQIQEIPNGDNLDLTGNDIVNVDNIAVISTLTVNGNNITADYNDLSNRPTIPTDISQLTDTQSLLTGGPASVSWTTITGTPTTLAGYGITDGFSGAYADLSGQPTALSQFTNDTNFITLADVTGGVSVNPTGDLQGSVFGDDSTLLVDGTNSNIPKANIQDSTNWDTAYSWGDHSVAGYITSYTETDTLDSVISRGAVTTTTAVIPFFYADQAAFPNATTYHGAIAHSHADEAMFFAHGGNWIELANKGGVPTTLLDLNISDGTANQVLSTDGAGNFTFVDQEGSSVTPPLQQVTNAGAITADEVTFSGGIIVDAIAPSVGVGPTVHTGNFDIQGSLSLTGDVDAPGGTITADVFASNGTGTPTIESTTNINLDAGNTISFQISSSQVSSVTSAGFVGPLTGDVTGNVTGNVTGTLDGEVKGSVFADNSTLLVDGVNGTIPYSVISGTGNEAYDTFATSTTYNPGGAVTHGSYIRNEADTADVAASVTVTPGFSKIKVELDASIANLTDATTEMLIALERTVDGLNPTTVKIFLFPVANTFYGSQHFLYVDTHGASSGSTVEYKLKVDMSSYSNESARVQYGICGDTLYIKEIA